MGGKERERWEGKERFKEKVVKLEGWGERVNRRREKQREADGEKVEFYGDTEGKVKRERWRNEWRRKKQKSIFSAGIRTSVGGEGMLRLPKTLYTPTMIRTPAHTHTHIHISLRKELIRTVRGLSLPLWPQCCEKDFAPNLYPATLDYL